MTSADSPTIGLADSTLPGRADVYGTCKALHTFYVYDSKTSTSHIDLVNSKYKREFTLEMVRELCQVKGAGSRSNLYCTVVSHVTFMKKRTQVEFRHRFGWGTANIPVLQARSINDWVTTSKRPYDDDDGANGETGKRAKGDDQPCEQPAPSQPSESEVNVSQDCQVPLEQLRSN